VEGVLGDVNVIDVKLLLKDGLRGASDEDLLLVQHLHVVNVDVEERIRIPSHLCHVCEGDHVGAVDVSAGILDRRWRVEEDALAQHHAFPYGKHRWTKVPHKINHVCTVQLWKHWFWQWWWC